MRCRLPLFLALFALIAVSCDQQPVEPPTGEVSTEASFDFLNNPDNGNPRIWRGEDYWRFCWSDADSDYRDRVCHVSYPWPGGPPQACDIPDVGPALSHQDVGDWDTDNPRILHVIKGDTWVTIRDTWEEGDCYGNAEVASGWGKFMVLDNDVFGIAEGDNNANTWQYKGTGTLMTPGGQKVSYNGKLHIRCNNSEGCSAPQEFVNFR